MNSHWRRPPRGTVIVWTDEKVEFVKTAFESGLPASAIADELRREDPMATRNAVIGKLNRLGLRREDRSAPIYLPAWVPSDLTDEFFKVSGVHGQRLAEQRIRAVTNGTAKVADGLPEHWRAKQVAPLPPRVIECPKWVPAHLVTDYLAFAAKRGEMSAARRARQQLMRSSALPAPMKPQAAVSVTASPATPSPGTGGGADPASIFSGITITELESSTCRWPLWNGFDEGVKLYCGCEVSVGPYCPAHAHIAYVPYVPRVVASREWQRA